MNPVTRFIARRLGAQIPETPARETSRPVAGQAGGGDLLPASVGQPVAGMSPASPAVNACPGNGGGGSPDPMQDEWRAFLAAKIDGRKAR